MMGTKRPIWLLFDGDIIGTYSTVENAEKARDRYLGKWPFNNIPNAKSQFSIRRPVGIDDRIILDDRRPE